MIVNELSVIHLSLLLLCFVFNKCHPIFLPKGASLPKTVSSGRWKVAVDRLKTQHPGGLVMKAGASPYLQSRRPSEQKRGRTKVL